MYSLLSFLFILVADYLSCLLEHSSSMGLIATRPIGTSSFFLNHLQFANDTLLFSIADRAVIQNLFDLVGIFECAFGLKINL